MVREYTNFDLRVKGVPVTRGGRERGSTCKNLADPRSSMEGARSAELRIALVEYEMRGAVS